MGVVMKAAEQVALRVVRVPVGDSYGKKIVNYSKLTVRQ